MKKVKRGNTYLYFNDEKSLEFFDIVENNRYKLLKVLKDDQRSYVALIEIQGKKYIYKRPIEKNSRKWQRFLSIFRGSESKREFKNIEKIREVGLNGAEPYLAVEKKKGLVVYDSYLIYGYIDGRESSFKDIELIMSELRKIHSLGYLHGDSHMNNFLIKGEKVYLIDTKLLWNKYGGFGRAFEFMYLEESCPQEIDYDKESIYYKGKKIRRGNIYLYLNDEKSLEFFDLIENNRYKLIKILKDDQRSYVALIEIQGKKYIYKRPIEKNSRKWQRFLSIFRGSESKREFKNIEKIREVGLNGAVPYLAVEKKKGLVVYDSYLIYGYIDGRESSFKDIDLIMSELRKIHSLGYLHGDSHMNNFLIKGEKVYLIDTKLLWNKYGGFGRAFEFMYLEESCPREIDYDKESIYYKGAKGLRNYLTFLAKIKSIRRKKK